MLAEQIMADYRQAPLPPRQRALLDFAVDITRRAHGMTQDRIDQFRAAGLSDEDLVNAVQITGYFNYYNRMVDALGCDLEDFMPPVAET